jgi:hypothetical protein
LSWDFQQCSYVIQIQWYLFFHKLALAFCFISFLVLLIALIIYSVDISVLLTFYLNWVLLRSICQMS